MEKMEAEVSIYRPLADVFIQINNAWQGRI